MGGGRNVALTELVSFLIFTGLCKLNSPQARRGVSKGVGTLVTPSGILWKVVGGDSGSVFFKNFASLCWFCLILEGGTFFFGFSRVLLVGVP